jgi:short subunit dehydrogenase-like uncharacterized protein
MSLGSNSLLIYGGNGYTGMLLARAALARELRPILCGRDTAKLRAAAETLDLEYRVAGLTDSGALDAVLRGVRVVVNAAGPFSATWQPLVDACLRARTHYLDISGEVASLDFVSRRHGEARAKGIMLMPGVGFDVVPSDCLARHVVDRMRRPRRLSIGITGLRSASRGSAQSTIEQIGKPVYVRRGGRLVSIPPASLERQFDYGDGPSASLAVSWADVVSAFFSTGVPNIDVFFEATPAVRASLVASRHLGWWMGSPIIQRWLKTWTALLPPGPDEQERETATAVVVAEAEDESGACVRARLRTPEVYSFTATSAAAIAARVLDGDWRAGYETPSRVYGADFPLSLPGVTREAA